jgi:hypothetical protein
MSYDRPPLPEQTHWREVALNRSGRFSKEAPLIGGEKGWQLRGRRYLASAISTRAMQQLTEGATR